jgi:hypothetical protein
VFPEWKRDGRDLRRHHAELAVTQLRIANVYLRWNLHHYVPSGEVGGARRTGPSTNLSSGARRYRCQRSQSHTLAKWIVTVPDPPHQPHRWPGNASRQSGHGLEAFIGLPR